MKKTRWLENLIYALILICYIVAANSILTNLYNKSQITYNIIPFSVWYIVLFLILGFLVGSLNLFREREKPGAWKINLFRLIFLGIPAFYYVLCLLIIYLNIKCLELIVSSYAVRSISSNMESVICVILGYTIVSSLYKLDE